MLASRVLPEEILLQILSKVPATDLIRHCALVCTLWRDVINSPTLWKIKCQDMGYISRECPRTPKDWKLFFYLSSKKRNLLENPSGMDGLNFWDIEQDDMKQWRIEDLEGNHGQDLPVKDVTKCFVTIAGPCRKSQLIDLKKMGYGEKLLDLVQPDIVIRDWYAAKRDCSSSYGVFVKLLSEKKTIKRFKPKLVIKPGSDAHWHQITHTFSNYGPGVRYVYFEHSGNDLQGWIGWFGFRVTSSSVTVEPEDLRA